VARVGSREETGNRFGTDTADEKCVFWSGYGWHGHDWWRRHGHPTHSTFSFGYYGTPHYSHYSYWPPSCHHWHGRPTGHLFRPTRPFGFRPHHGSHAGSGVYLYFSW